MARAGAQGRGQQDDYLDYDLNEYSNRSSSSAGPPRDQSMGGLTPRLGRRAASAYKEELIKEWQRLQRQVRADLGAQDKIFGEIVGRPSLSAQGDGGIVRLDDNDFDPRLPRTPPEQDLRRQDSHQEQLERRIQRLEGLEAKLLQTQSGNGNDLPAVLTPRGMDLPAPYTPRPSLPSETKTPRGIDTILENADQSVLPFSMERALDKASTLPVPPPKKKANKTDGVDLDALKKTKRAGGVPRRSLMNNAAHLLRLDSIGAHSVMDYVYHEVLDFRGWMLKNLYELTEWWAMLKDGRHHKLPSGPFIAALGSLMWVE